jgi:hypothetical protein
VQRVLDGPFHAYPGCNAALAEVPTGASAEGSASPQFDERCKNCGQRVFCGARLNEGFGVSVWAVRVGALEELQRMHRNGTKLPEAQWSPPIVLENPGYWQLMLPVEPTNSE